jgi:hypothetical protein
VHRLRLICLFLFNVSCNGQRAPQLGDSKTMLRSGLESVLSINRDEECCSPFHGRQDKRSTSHTPKMKTSRALLMLFRCHSLYLTSESSEAL